MKSKILKDKKEIVSDIHNAGERDIDTVIKDLDTSINGLSPIQAADRLDIYGSNKIVYDESKPWYLYLLRGFLDPFSLILIAIVFLSYFTDVAFVAAAEQSWATIIIISIMIIISVVLRFTQEYKSQVTADNLRDLIPTTTAIQRGGNEATEIVMSKVVPGDIIHLAAGDLIPADMRIIESTDLFISQSSLTGESEPIEKFSTISKSDRNKNLSDLDNIALMGTIVVSGSAKGVV